MDARTCPAAHSMDTTWFAVDADGCVGVFQTGEAGALPLSATATPEGGDFDAWPLDAIVIARALVEGRLPEAERAEPEHPYVDRVVLVLRPDPTTGPTTYRDPAGRTYSIQERLGELVTVLHEQDPRVVATMRPLPDGLHAELLDDPRVERVVYPEELWEWRESGGGTIYAFGNDTYDDPGAYRCEGAPTAPLTVDALPGELAQQIASLKLPVRFAESSSLHLADHFADDECVTWGHTTLRGAPRTPEPGPSARRSASVQVVLVLAVSVLALLLLYLVLR